MTTDSLRLPISFALNSPQALVSMVTLTPFYQSARLVEFCVYKIFNMLILRYFWESRENIDFLVRVYDFVSDAFRVLIIPVALAAFEILAFYRFFYPTSTAYHDFERWFLLKKGRNSQISDIYVSFLTNFDHFAFPKGKMVSLLTSFGLWYMIHIYEDICDRKSEFGSGGHDETVAQDLRQA